MMDAARAAAMSDPEQNRWFRRRWIDVDPPCLAPAEQAGLSHASLDTTDSFDMLGRELLAAWRRERAAQAGQSDGNREAARGVW